MTALVSMGFERDAAAAALLQTGDNLEQAVALLTGENGDKAGHSLASRTRQISLAAREGRDAAASKQAKRGGDCSRNFIVGSRVKAKWKAPEGGKKWFKGQIKLVNPGGTYYIVYDDGDVEDDVLECNLQVFLDQEVDQEVEILEGPSTLLKTRVDQQDAMHMVRDLQARIQVKKEVMEEEQYEHAQRHAQLQSVVEAKIIEAEELRGRLKDIALAFECTFCFEKLGAGSVSFGCGHTYCNKPTCGSRLVDTCPECRLPVTTRVQLFGTLPDVGGLLEQEPAAPDVGQVQRLAAENAEASLEEIRKRSAADKSVWQREREEMQRQANRLKEEVMAAENAKAENAKALEEMRQGREEDKAAWVREREEMQRQVNSNVEHLQLAAKHAEASLEEMRERREEDMAVWQRERDEMQQHVNRLQEEVKELRLASAQQATTHEQALQLQRTIAEANIATCARLEAELAQMRLANLTAAQQATTNEQALQLQRTSAEAKCARLETELAQMRLAHQASHVDANAPEFAPAAEFVPAPKFAPSPEFVPARDRSASHTLQGDAVLEADVERSMENDAVPNPLANTGRGGINDCSKAGATQRVDRDKAGQSKQARGTHQPIQAIQATRYSVYCSVDLLY
jgi:hypothetical protein